VFLYCSAHASPLENRSTDVPSSVRRALSPALKKLLRRRIAIESEIGHMKTGGRLARCR